MKLRMGGMDLERETTEFDRHAGDYCSVVDSTVSFTHESTVDYARQKAELLRPAVARLLGAPNRLAVLDVGCGTGVMEPFLVGHFNRVVGGDVSTRMVDVARRTCAGAEFVNFEKGRLPFADDSFDVQFCACVYHHVCPDDRASFVAEVVRVVRPGGLVFVFEHNPYNPLTRAVVRACPLDADAILLTRAQIAAMLRRAGLRVVEQRYYLFFPKMLNWLRPLEKYLGWLPLGAQYYVAARKI